MNATETYTETLEAAAEGWRAEMTRLAQVNEELLAAAKRALDLLEWTPGTSAKHRRECIEPVEHQLRAAVAKAEG